MNSTSILLVYDWKRPSTALRMHLPNKEEYPNSLSVIVDNSFEDATSTGTEIAFHGLELRISLLLLVQHQHPTTLALPLLQLLITSLVDFPTVMFRMNCTLT